MCDRWNRADRLKKWQWVELFHPRGYQKLVSSLRSRAIDVGMQFPPTPDEEKGEPKGDAAIAKFVAQEASFSPGTRFCSMYLMTPAKQNK